MIDVQPEYNITESSSGSNIVARLAKVSKNYGQVQALKDVNLSLRGGELLALLGPNGAGKTTAVKMLLGMAIPTRGSVNVLGGNPAVPSVRTRIGAMLQVAKVPETLRVREHIDIFSSYYPKSLPLAQTLASAGLESIKDRKFGDLSGGQKQRVLFGLAICGDPDIVFLDEPTVGMDVEARRGLWDEIRNLLRRGKTVLLTTHYLEEADALADRVVVINKGEIVAEGSPAEIKAQTAGRKIRCVTRLDLEHLRSLPGVQSVSRDREAFDIRAINAEVVLRELFAHDPDVRGIEVTSAGLEDAFLALTSSDQSTDLRRI
jgi:ABC-2 type transport system ATP-binding protein